MTAKHASTADRNAVTSGVGGRRCIVENLSARRRTGENLEGTGEQRTVGDHVRVLEVDHADAQPFQRGVNSFQLWFDGTRWYVVSIFWEPETPSNPIPAELLTGVRP